MAYRPVVSPTSMKRSTGGDSSERGRATYDARVHRAHHLVIALVLALGLSTISSVALAAPEAHLLAVDARAGIAADEPAVRTLVQLGQATPIADVLAAACGKAQGEDVLGCISSA